MAQAGADVKPAHLIGIEFTNRLDNNEEFVRFRGGDIAGDLDTLQAGLDGVGLRLVECTPWQVYVMWPLMVSTVVGQ